MKAKTLIVIVLIFLLFSLRTFFLINADAALELDKARKESASEAFESEFGVTRYQVHGTQNTSTVILIHSFNGFLESWNPNIDALVNAGYRVITYDLFGRGLSDRPNEKYDLVLFRAQLNALIKELELDEVDLAGSSFGCVIASDYAKNHPHRVKKLVMIGPAGWPQKEGSNPALNIPIISDVIFHYFGKQILRSKVEEYFMKPLVHQEYIHKWDGFSSYAGYTRSALSTLKHSPVLDYTPGWEQLGQLKKPTLFLWGKQDISFPFENTKKIPSLVPHAQIIGIEEAAHWVNIEQADQVNKRIVSFLISESDDV